MDLTNTDIKCYINNKLIGTPSTDKTVNGYRFGLEAGGSQVYFDNVVVTPLP
jgi:hypothetical protein